MSEGKRRTRGLFTPTATRLMDQVRETSATTTIPYVQSRAMSAGF